MQLEAGEVRQPGEIGRMARHDLVGAAAGREADRGHLEPVGAVRRRALLEEELVADAVGVADQHAGAPARAAQRPLGDGEVVVHQVELPDLRLRKQQLGRVRDDDVTAVDA